MLSQLLCAAGIRNSIVQHVWIESCLTLCKLRSDHSLTGKDSLQKNLYLELLNVHYNSDLSLC